MKAKNNVIATFCFQVFCVVTVLGVHHKLLSQPFAPGDDFDFARVLSKTNFSHIGELWSTQWGWFYRPVFLTAFWSLLQIFGEDGRYFHAASVLLHGFNAALLGLLLARLAKRCDARLQSNRLSFLLSASAALAFIFYPGKHQAVEWISAASTLLSAFFYLLCLHCWLCFRDRNSIGFYIAVLITFYLALCSKEDALSLPLALLLLDGLFYKPAGLVNRIKAFAIPILLFGIYGLQAKAAFAWSTQHPRFEWISNPVSYRAVQPMQIMEFFSQAFWQQLDVVVAIKGESCSQPACLIYFHLSDLGTSARWIALTFSLATCAAAAVLIGVSSSKSFKKFGWFALGWCLAVAVPLPMLAGNYIAIYWWRFYYLPAMPVSMLWTYFVCLLVMSTRRNQQLKELNPTLTQI